MSRGPKYSYQRQYPYICTGCGKKRFTRKYNRRADEVCTICKQKMPDKNQVSLFDIEQKQEEQQ